MRTKICQIFSNGRQYVPNVGRPIHCWSQSGKVVGKCEWIYVVSGVFGGAIVRPLPLWSDCEFWTIFALFLLASLRDWTVKFVFKALRNCPCFLPVENCIKMHPNVLSFWGQKWFFFHRGAQPLHHITPSRRLLCLAPYWNLKYSTVYSAFIVSSRSRRSDHTVFTANYTIPAATS